MKLLTVQNAWLSVFMTEFQYPLNLVRMILALAFGWFSLHAEESCEAKDAS